MRGSDSVPVRLRQHFQRLEAVIVRGLAETQTLPGDTGGYDAVIANQDKRLDELAALLREQDLLWEEWCQCEKTPDEEKAIRREAGEIALMLRGYHKLVESREHEAREKMLEHDGELRKLRRDRSNVNKYRPGESADPRGGGWNA